MTKINDDSMRNAFRFRRAPSRPRTTTKNMHSLEIYEQLEAIKLGLTDDPTRSPTALENVMKK
tara:strand:- start:789 stop:977 length:189 start_codon:yes stop_codon:yes gene_type:complete